MEDARGGVEQWTHATLLRYLDSRIVALDQLTDAKFVTFRTLVDAQANQVALALDAADKAVSKAEMATAARFESVNEFRAQLDDQQRTLMSRNEAMQRIDSLVERVTDMSTRLDRAEGRVGGSREMAVDARQQRLTATAMASAMASVVAVLVAIAALSLR